MQAELRDRCSQSHLKAAQFWLSGCPDVSAWPPLGSGRATWESGVLETASERRGEWWGCAKGREESANTFGRWGGEMWLWARGERTGPASSSKPAPDPRVEAGLSQPQVALHSLGCACMGVVCVVLQVGEGLKTTWFCSFWATAFQRLVREIFGEKKKVRISNDSSLFAFNILEDLLCVCMSCCN